MSWKVPLTIALLVLMLAVLQWRLWFDDGSFEEVVALKRQLAEQQQEVADMRSGLDIPTPEHKSWDPRFTEAQEWNGKNDFNEEVASGVYYYRLEINDGKIRSQTKQMMLNR